MIKFKKQPNKNYYRDVVELATVREVDNVAAYLHKIKDKLNYVTPMIRHEKFHLWK